jgi:hypothetical protein
MGEKITFPRLAPRSLYGLAAGILLGQPVHGKRWLQWRFKNKYFELVMGICPNSNAYGMRVLPMYESMWDCFNILSWSALRNPPEMGKCCRRCRYCKQHTALDQYPLP